MFTSFLLGDLNNMQYQLLEQILDNGSTNEEGKIILVFALAHHIVLTKTYDVEELSDTFMENWDQQQVKQTRKGREPKVPKNRAAEECSTPQGVPGSLQHAPRCVTGRLQLLPPTCPRAWSQALQLARACSTQGAAAIFLF